MDYIDPIYQEIEDWRLRVGMTRSSAGLYLANDTSLMQRLKMGRELRRKTAAYVRARMAEKEEETDS